MFRPSLRYSYRHNHFYDQLAKDLEPKMGEAHEHIKIGSIEEERAWISKHDPMPLPNIHDSVFVLPNPIYWWLTEITPSYKFARRRLCVKTNYGVTNTFKHFMDVSEAVSTRYIVQSSDGVYSTIQLPCKINFRLYEPTLGEVQKLLGELTVCFVNLAKDVEALTQTLAAKGKSK